MRSQAQEVLAVGLGFLTILVLAYFLHRPRLQQSERYQATVVPLANIMDVGFIILTPAIVLLVGLWAPLVMLGICLIAIAAGFVIAYNIRHYEPLRETSDPTNRVEAAARWALLSASVANIGYYTLLLWALLLLPFDAFTETRASWTGAVFLGLIAAIGVFGGITWLNRQGDRTTAFNLAAVIGVLVAFIVFNIEEAISGRWAVGESPAIGSEDVRKIIGLFAIVQGFEAARYIGIRFGPELRITTMRIAQGISTVVFVLLTATLLVIFLPPRVETSGTAIFAAAKIVDSGLMPWLLLLAAIGSQNAAIIGATSSRSDMLVGVGVRRPLTFLIILVPAILIVLFTDVTEAVNIASRVFAAYFLIQALLAVTLARRARNWWAVAGFAAVGLIMALIMIFGLPL